MKKVAVIGGGAAGLTAAISAARNGVAVTVFEKADRIGKKILVTGNGRCNLGNADIRPEFYNNHKFVSDVFKYVDATAVNAFFASIGVWTKADGEGRLYPVTEQASTVINCFLSELNRLKIKVITNCAIALDSDYRVINGERFDSVVLTVGNIAGSDGKYINPLSALGYVAVEPMPSLVPLVTDKTYLRGMNGIRVSGKLTLLKGSETVACEQGEILFREYGLSGIAVFNMSAVIARATRKRKGNFVLSLDLYPDMDESELSARLVARLDKFDDTQEFLCGIVNKNLGANLASALCLGKTVVQSDISAVARLLKGIRFSVIGARSAAQAQVMCGGLDMSQFDLLQSIKDKDLYVAGEVLDIDGLCGGYNLFWAWASGILAGTKASDDTY